MDKRIGSNNVTRQTSLDPSHFPGVVVTPEGSKAAAA